MPGGSGVLSAGPHLGRGQSGKEPEVACSCRRRPGVGRTGTQTAERGRDTWEAGAN